MNLFLHVKVKRLFLYMAEKSKHQWVGAIETEKIDLGKGVRSLAHEEVLVSKFHITIPRELAEYE